MWIKLRHFICSLFRRFQLLLGSLAVILLAVFLPISASADTINIKSDFGGVSSNALITRYSDGLPVDRLEKQYFYGGDYNPLILADTQAAGYSWTGFDASAYVSFNRTVPAGTTLRISCGGWFNHSYIFSDTYKPRMYVSPYNIADVSNGSYENYLGSRVLLGTGSGSPVQTSNGQYCGYLFSGSFTPRFPMSGIYFCFSGSLSSARTGGAYFGISCDSITISVDHVSPAESDVYGTPESGALDDTSAALGDLDNAESALLQENSAGLNYGQSMLSDAKLVVQQFVLPLQAVGKLFEKMIEKIPISGLLIVISGSLGLFMFLLGMAGEIYGRGRMRDRERLERANANAREADKYNWHKTETITVKNGRHISTTDTFSRRSK